MKERYRSLKLSKLMYAILAFAAGAVIALQLTAAEAYAATISVTWSSVSLTSDGDCSWAMSGPASMEVDKYELKFARKTDGAWKTDYKTVKTSDDSYTMRFTAKGQYYYEIRARFIGGDMSNWSGPSNTVSVTADDTTHGGGSGGGYIVVPTGGGSSYVYPAGPGANGYQNNSTSIGPGAYGYNNNTYNPGAASNYTYSGPNASITGSNQQSGWIREGDRWRYRYSNNTYAMNSWDRIDDKWYYFDSSGYMARGWVYYNSNWYLCGLDGHMLTGWNMVDNKWYYLDKSGIMQTGYIEVDGVKYYCDQSGARFQGGYNPDGHYYDESGVQIK